MYPLILTIALAGQPAATVSPKVCEPAATVTYEQIERRRRPLLRIAAAAGRTAGKFLPFHRRGRRG